MSISRTSLNLDYLTERALCRGPAWMHSFFYAKCSENFWKSENYRHVYCFGMFEHLLECLLLEVRKLLECLPLEVRNLLEFRKLYTCLLFWYVRASSEMSTSGNHKTIDMFIVFGMFEYFLERLLLEARKLRIL